MKITLTIETEEGRNDPVPIIQAILEKSARGVARNGFITYTIPGRGTFQAHYRIDEQP